MHLRLDALDGGTAGILDCGGKRSAAAFARTKRFPVAERLPSARKRCRRCALPAHSMTFLAWFVSFAVQNAFAAMSRRKCAPSKWIFSTAA